MVDTVRRLLPGIALLVILSLTARGISAVAPIVNHLIAAVVLGAVLTNLWGVPGWAAPGISLHKLLLEAGIVLMGVRITFDAVAVVGPRVVVVVVGVVVFTVCIVELLARTIFDLPEKTGSLVAAGASICGVSAIVAVAGGIAADEDQVAYAVATVLLFDAFTLFVFPLVAHALALPDLVFGVWAGVAMYSTGPVAAAGFAYSDVAGQWATMTKLVRNLLLSAAVVGYSVYYARRTVATTPRSNVGLVWEKFPKFIVGFLLVMVVANAGLLAPQQVTSATNASRWFFLLAFAGFGMHVDLDQLRTAGVQPVALLLATLIVVGAVSLGVVSFLFS